MNIYKAKINKYLSLRNYNNFKGITYSKYDMSFKFHKILYLK